MNVNELLVTKSELVVNENEFLEKVISSCVHDGLELDVNTNGLVGNENRLVAKGDSTMGRHL